MEAVHPRTQKVLKAAVKEFIHTGLPVSSAFLHEKYAFGVKPATIRAELSRLTDDGFLIQPHTSAGRVPTDRGYEFFVSRLFSNREINLPDFGFKLDKFFEDDLDKLVNNFSERLRVLGVGYEPNEGEIYKSGLEELFRYLDFVGREDIYEIVRDFELIDERIETILNYLSGHRPRVFIGKSPITKSRHLSVIANVYDKHGEKTVLLAIGSKRMDYEKVLRLFQALK